MLTQIMHVNFSSMTAPHLISVVQGDTGRNLKCIVDDFTLDGAWTATWYVERPSDVPVYNTATIETSDNSVNLELTAQSINEVGDNKLQVRILDADEQVVTSFACILSVKPFGGIGAVESSTESNIFDQQVEEAFDEIDTHKADALEEIDTEIDTHVADGKFPNMAAGDIISDLYAENKVPYFFRTSGGGAEVGKIEAPVLVGGSVGWNQLLNALSDDYWKAENANVTVTYDNGVASITSTAGGSGLQQRTQVQTIKGHKYLHTFDAKTANSLSVRFSVSGGGVGSQTAIAGDNAWHNIASISDIGVDTGTHNVYIYVQESAYSNLGVKNVVLIDLTLLLGSTIADRIYTLEQSTAGSGIAQLKAWGFDFDEYVPYSAPTLKHVEGVSAHVMRDADDNIIGNYPLDASLTLRGIPKLDANNQLYYDGDTYAHDGTVTKKYGAVDLGGLVWHYDSGNNQFYSDQISDATNSDWNLNCVCQKYAIDQNNYSNNPTPHIRGINKKRIYLVDETYASDPTSIETALSGIYLVYELATATTETATPFAEYQEVDATGTEEYVSTGVVPVGHDTKYPTDLKGTLETILSAIPSANGTYALKVTVNNGKRTFSWV